MKRTYILLKVSRDSGEVNKLKNVMKYSKHGNNIIHKYTYVYIYIHTSSEPLNTLVQTNSKACKKHNLTTF
jgi:hypothetical protein